MSDDYKYSDKWVTDFYEEWDEKINGPLDEMLMKMYNMGRAVQVAWILYLLNKDDITVGDIKTVIKKQLTYDTEIIVTVYNLLAEYEMGD